MCGEAEAEAEDEDARRMHKCLATQAVVFIANIQSKSKQTG